MECFNYLDEQNIKIPKKWKMFYGKKDKICEETLCDNPFGPCEWKLMSIKDIEEQVENRNKNKQYIDLAIIQMGMGHYAVCSMTKDGKTFFFRKDGGSNGWDRYYNLKLYEDWDPSVNNPKFTVSQTINILEDSDITPFEISDNMCQSGNIAKAKAALHAELKM